MDDLTRDEVMRMHEADLAVRVRMIDAMRETGGGIIALVERDEMRPILADVERVDAEHSRLAMAILDRVGWPTESVVGSEAADAWTHLITQRVSGETVDYSVRHLRAAAARGEVSDVTAAQVEDRTAVLHGRPQRHGTQWTQSEGGYEPHRMDDPVKVDVRRARLGLASLAEHKHRIEEMFGGP